MKKVKEKELKLSEIEDPADKIFDKLGFDGFKYIRYIEYFSKKNKLYISFDTKTKTVEICGYDSVNKQIDIELFNAIFLKKRELGWIGDDKNEL